MARSRIKTMVPSIIPRRTTASEQSAQPVLFISASASSWRVRSALLLRHVPSSYLTARSRLRTAATRKAFSVISRPANAANGT